MKTTGSLASSPETIPLSMQAKFTVILSSSLVGLITKGELPCRPLTHKFLVGIRTNSSKCRWNLMGKGSYCAN